jgi:hypothetical protein
LARPAGFEPTTPSSEDWCSDPLSYGRASPRVFYHSGKANARGLGGWAGDRYEQNAAAAEKLQALAKKQKTAAVCLSQVSKEGARAGAKHGGVIAAKGAGEWGAAATTVL